MSVTGVMRQGARCDFVKARGSHGIAAFRCPSTALWSKARRFDLQLAQIVRSFGALVFLIRIREPLRISIPIRDRAIIPAGKFLPVLLPQRFDQP